MNKKERTIAACRELAEKYRNPRGKIFFDVRYCSLCAINNVYSVFDDCRGCFMAKKKWSTTPGCTRFKSYQKTVDAYLLKSKKYGNYELKKRYEARAAFFDKIIPILEKAPASQFTKKGWKPFNIPLDW